MVQLAFNKYTALDFKKIDDQYRYVNMTGTPGFKSNMLILSLIHISEPTRRS